MSQNGVTKIELEGNTDAGLSQLDSLFDKSRVIFTGENHAYKSFNIDFQFTTLKYLYKNHHTRNFLIEQSPGLSHIINRITLNQDSIHKKFLKEVLLSQFYELVENLESFNANLSDTAKIVTHGIDVERFPRFSIYALAMLIDSVDEQSEGGVLFEQIRALASVESEYDGPDAYYEEGGDVVRNFQMGQVDLSASLNSILIDAQAFEKNVRTSLGKDSTVFYVIINGLIEGRKWYQSEKEGNIKSPILRERFMVDEFKRIYEFDRDSKYYGQFGRCHLNKNPKDERCYSYYVNSVANRIAKIDSTWRNDVLVVPIYYTRSKSFDSGVIKTFNLPDDANEEEVYLVDLRAFPTMDSIVGFDRSISHVFVSSYKRTPTISDLNIEPKLDVHIGVGYTQYFFSKLRPLNVALNASGLNGFTNKFLGYSVGVDVVYLNENGGHFEYVYLPPISNNQGMSLKGSMFTFGSSYPVGNKFFLAAFGTDIGFGVMKLSEIQQNGDPLLIQVNEENKVLYKNDLFTVDPNIRLRITLPIVSLNCKFGYMFDVSGKYWRIDNKVETFPKTSFTALYLQVGASLHFRE
jgi:hypothetical protein